MVLQTSGIWLVAVTASEWRDAAYLSSHASAGRSEPRTSLSGPESKHGRVAGKNHARFPTSSPVDARTTQRSARYPVNTFESKPRVLDRATNESPVNNQIRLRVPRAAATHSTLQSELRTTDTVPSTGEIELETIQWRGRP